jgi:small-conductance mechanosensitive channel
MDLSALDHLVARFAEVPTSWPVAIGVAVGVWAAGALVYALAFRLLRRLSAMTTTTLDDRLVGRMRIPARLLVLLFAVHALMALRGADHHGPLAAVIVVEVLLLAFLVVETGETIFFHYWLGERKKVQVPAVVRHVVLVVVYGVVALSVLGTVTGLDLVPILATSTVVTVVVGLALQDTLGNLFSGLALHAEQPFSIGDWVLVDGVEGCVVHIGWRSVHLRTFSDDIVALPNSIVARARVQNFDQPTRLTSRNVEVPVSPAASPEQVERAVAVACARLARIRTDPPPKVWLTAYTPLFHRYIVKIWIDEFRVHDDTESDLLKALWHALRDEGVALPVADIAVDADGRALPAQKQDRRL